MTDFLALTNLLQTGRDDNHIVAIHPDGKKVSWLQFSNDIAQLETALRESSVTDYILSCEEIYNFTVGLMALINARKSIIIPPNMQPETVASIGKKTGGEIIDDRLQIAEGKGINARELAEAEIIIYTSGSSGEATAISKPLSALEQEVKSFHQLWHKQVANSLFASSVAHYHLYGLSFQLLWPLCSGEPFLLKRVSYPEELPEYGKIQNLSFISSPAFLKPFAEAADKNDEFEFITFATSSGAALPVEVAVQMQEILPKPITEIYGSTETGAIATKSPPIESLWHCLPQVEARSDEQGDLLIRSAHAGQNGWLEIADQVEFEGELFRLKSRSDRIVKIHDKRVSLTQLENICDSSPWISATKLVVLNSSKRLGVVAVLNEEGKRIATLQGKRELVAKLREYLIDYVELILLPRKWRFVEDFPYNSMGKVQQSSLLDLFNEGEK